MRYHRHEAQFPILWKRASVGRRIIFAFIVSFVIAIAFRKDYGFLCSQTAQLSSSPQIVVCQNPLNFAKTSKVLIRHTGSFKHYVRWIGSQPKYYALYNCSYSNYCVAFGNGFLLHAGWVHTHPSGCSCYHDTCETNSRKESSLTGAIELFTKKLLDNIK